MPLDVSHAESAAHGLATTLGLSTLALAEGILRVANANMERAIRVVSVQRGFDPRDFALLAFSGAGGLHACDLAASLDIGTVLIPQHSGVLSALGMLLADVAKDYSASLLGTTAWTSQDLAEALRPLVQRALAELTEEGFATDLIRLTAAVSVRYKGQSFEIDVPLPGSLAHPETDALVDDFHKRHARLYGYSNPTRATEAVQLRVRAVGRTEKPPLAASHPAEPQTIPLPGSTRQIILRGPCVETPVFHRDRLATGAAGHGPALILTGESTNLVPPGWAWHIDLAGTLVVVSKESESPNAI